VCAKINRKTSKGRTSGDVSDAYPRITRFCAYQERSHHEVREKLSEFGVNTEDADAILARLITDGFVNEERFAKAFAGGKFRIKRWGRIRIEHALQSHQISGRCVKIGLREIDEEDYLKSLRQIISSKAAAIVRDDVYQKWDAVSKYAIAKGYEPDLVWKVIRELRDNKQPQLE
jgi:regulatory protein